MLPADAKKGGEEAAARAEELLREMENLYKLGDSGVNPNRKTYCAVISEFSDTRRTIFDNLSFSIHITALFLFCPTTQVLSARVDVLDTPKRRSKY